MNEKIEGYFRTCLAVGLTGRQGVLIPAANVTDLCLDDDVIAACQNGTFRIWSAASVADGVEMLMQAPLETVLEECGATLDRYQEIARLRGRGVRGA